MDFDTLLESSESIYELKCKVCNNLLSYFPVHSSSSGDDLNVCGRCCTQIDDQHRNKAYEMVAQVVHFPCRFEGCNKKLLPKDTPRHEQICLYKTIKCPVEQTTQCDWTGPFITVLEHCQQQHDHLFPDNNKFKVDLTASYQREILLQYNTSLLIFTIGFDTTNSVFQYSLHHIEDEVNLESVSCEVRLKNETTAIVEKSNSTIFTERTMVQMPLEVLLRNNKSVAFGEINLGQPSDGMQVGKVVSDEMLSKLKCSTCSCYALPPIYQRGNEIKCSKCADGDSLGIPSLDSIAAFLNYPCKNRAYGCTLALRPSEMEKHQMICPYTNHYCMAKRLAVPCEWLGFGKDMVAHIQAAHPDMIIENKSEVTVQYTAEFLSHGYMIIFDNRVFLLLFSIDKARNKRSIDGTGPNDGLKLIRCYKWMPLTSTIGTDFVCEIEVTDGSNSGRKLVGSRPCQSLRNFHKNVKEGLITEADWCCFTYDQIHAVNDVDDQITFRVSISKL